MPKSLGQIHTVKFNYETLASGTGSNNAHLCDVSGKLTQQFNRQIRQMQNFKMVGIDLVAQLPDSITIGADRVICKGRLRYFQPTKGRCDALRTAYQQVMSQMRDRGIDPRDNRGYDFRVLPRGVSNYTTNIAYDTVALTNNSTLNGTKELAMTDNTAAPFEVFDSHNANVRPQITSGTADFAEGLQTQIGTIVTATDFVLNDGEISEGNPNFADTDMEEIPFELAYDSTARRVTQFNWRPDPALYLSVLTGQVEIVLDEITAAGQGTGELPGIEIDCSIHIAGWKSILKRPTSRSKFRYGSQQKKIAKQVSSKLMSGITSKEARTLARLLKKLK